MTGFEWHSSAYMLICFDSKYFSNIPSGLVGTADIGGHFLLGGGLVPSKFCLVQVNCISF